jgi:hypothetical protein
MVKIDQDKEERIRELEKKIVSINSRSTRINYLGVRWRTEAPEGAGRLEVMYKNDSGEWVSAGGFDPPV